MIRKDLYTWAELVLALRRYRRSAMLLGLTVGLSALAFWFCLGGRGGQATGRAHYRTLAERAASAGQFESSRLCYERLLREDLSDQPSAYGLAIAYDALGRRDACAALISRLTEAPGSGYPPAHLFAAERLLGQSAPSEQDLQRAESHLSKVVAGDPANAEAAVLLSTLQERRAARAPTQDAGKIDAR